MINLLSIRYFSCLQLIQLIIYILLTYWIFVIKLLIFKYINWPLNYSPLWTRKLKTERVSGPPGTAGGDNMEVTLETLSKHNNMDVWCRSPTASTNSLLAELQMYTSSTNV